MFGRLDPSDWIVWYTLYPRFEVPVFQDLSCAQKALVRVSHLSASAEEA